MTPSLPSTPRRDGFRMPAEWEPHAGCWMLWPERPDVWRERAAPAQATFTEVAAAIAAFEPVTVGALPAQVARARRMLPERVRVVPIHYNDAWMRDIGPTFVVNDASEVRGVDWHFNAWGGLYADWSLDETVPEQLLAQEGIGRYRADLVMEGGAIHVDGEGTLLVTEQCLLHPTRNPQLTRSGIERRLREFLNVETVIWLGDGVYNDETSGHVDNLCCFVRPGVVALTWTDDPEDPQFAISQDAYERLCRATDARGRRLAVHRLHQPGPLALAPEESAGIAAVAGSHPRPPHERLAASYINFYLPNGGVIAPLFDDPYDEAALDTLRRLFPEREVVGIHTREILLGGGNIHCITQQQPVGQ